jgi:hypothetical protein
MRLLSCTITISRVLILEGILGSAGHTMWLPIAPKPMKPIVLDRSCSLAIVAKDAKAALLFEAVIEERKGLLCARQLRFELTRELRNGLNARMFDWARKREELEEDKRLFTAVQSGWMNWWMKFQALVGSYTPTGTTHKHDPTTLRRSELRSGRRYCEQLSSGDRTEMSMLHLGKVYGAHCSDSVSKS